MRSKIVIWRHLPQGQFVERAAGESLTLSCQVDAHYDSCDWNHPTTGIRCGVKHTWVWDYLNAHYKDVPRTERECSDPLRFSVPDDKRFRHCNITIRRIGKKDAGDWSCQVKIECVGRKKLLSGCTVLHLLIGSNVTYYQEEFTVLVFLVR